VTHWYNFLNPRKDNPGLLNKLFPTGHSGQAGKDHESAMIKMSQEFEAVLKGKLDTHVKELAEKNWEIEELKQALQANGQESSESVDALKIHAETSKGIHEKNLKLKDAYIQNLSEKNRDLQEKLET
jgi:ABC-type uncharacterized transport system YnjBCD substrate-binding protein